MSEIPSLLVAFPTSIEEIPGIFFLHLSYAEASSSESQHNCWNVNCTQI